MTADLHIHTDTSFDGERSFDERIDDAREHGLETIALTDHNAVNPRMRRREQKVGEVTVITGIEISCFGEYGQLHILGYFVDPETIREKLRKTHQPKYLDGIRFIHDAGGAAVLAHPGRYPADTKEIVEDLVDKRLDGIEVEYSYEKSGFSSDLVGEAREIAERFDLVKTGGTDCHGGRRNNIGSIMIESGRVEELRESTEKYRKDA